VPRTLASRSSAEPGGTKRETSAIATQSRWPSGVRSAKTASSWSRARSGSMVTNGRLRRSVRSPSASAPASEASSRRQPSGKPRGSWCRSQSPAKSSSAHARAGAGRAPARALRSARPRCHRRPGSGRRATARGRSRRRGAGAARGRGGRRTPRRARPCAGAEAPRPGGGPLARASSSDALR
jgi:hypothetical protein